jgi:hypothetical protein
MSGQPAPSERFDELVSRLVDDGLSPVELAELEQFLKADPRRRESLTNHLLLDTLLQEEVGAESLTALVDVVTETNPVHAEVASTWDRLPACQNSAETTSSGTKTSGKPTGWKPIPRTRRAVCWMAGAALLALVAFLVGRWDNSALANAALIVRAAVETHADPIERVYLVDVASRARVAPQLDSESPSDSATSNSASAAREVRVMTQGDRFYVEMNRGQRQWYWGRNADGGVWLTVGPRRAMVVEADELGPPLEYIANLYSLNLESLLANFLKHCSLSRANESDSTHVITVTPRSRWRGGWVKSARIEVDRETKTVRRLTIQRELPQQGPSTVTFTLVESRPADESKYRSEGHLTEPFRLLSRDSQPDSRRELLVNWFGSYAERWIKSPGTAVPTNGKNAIQN